MTTQTPNADPTTNTIPKANPTYVAHGHHDHVAKIIASGLFAPTYVTGLSGNGKTTMIEQACASLNRGCIRANITSETDEDCLLGGYRLQNGTMTFMPGPAIVAMERGDILLLDEVDLGTERMMCLQPILEGKGIYVKKIMKFYSPAPGFNVFATANTKGAGEGDAFVGTRVLNEAFLDRFSFWYEQDYAERNVEARIIIKKMQAFGKEDKEFAQNLTKWSEAVRIAYKSGGTNGAIITTRRLEEICKAYAIFDDKSVAMQMCLARFDPSIQKAFWDFYTKIDPTVFPAPIGANATVANPVNPAQAV